MTPMITQNGQPVPTGQTPLRTPVRDKLNINQPDDMDPAMYESFEQVRIYILAHEIEKFNVLPWMRYSYFTHVISPRAHILLHRIGCIGCLVPLSLSNVRMTSVLFKMANVNAGYFNVKLNLFKHWQKVCKKKNPTCVCG